MNLWAPRDGLSAASWLFLLLRAPLGADTPPPLSDPSDVLRRLKRVGPATAEAPLDPAERQQLAARAGRLDRLLSGWREQGWWLIGRDDPEFPRRLRRRLDRTAPALLWGRGDQALIGRGGIAVVSGAAALEPIPSVPGATLIRAGDEALCFTPGSAGGGAELRVSPPGQAPDDAEALRVAAYALADAVVATGLRRADPAWAGLVALIDADRQPVWVSGMAGDGALLLRAGARTVPPGELTAAALLAPKPSRDARALMRADPPAPPPGFAEAQHAFGIAETAMVSVPRRVTLRVVEGTTRDAPERAPSFAGPTFYALFEERLRVLLRHGPLGAGPIAAVMGLERVQADAWLDRALAESSVRLDPETSLYALN